MADGALESLGRANSPDFSLLAAAINVALLGRLKLTGTQSGHWAVATA